MSYAESSKVAATALGGSVARGWADQFSDLEVFVFWREPPSHNERTSAVRRSGGSIDVFWEDQDSERNWQAALRATDGKVGLLWPYDGEEWSEHYYIDDLNIGVSGFSVSTVDTWVRDLNRGVSTDIAEMVASTLLARAPITGGEILTNWVDQLEPYPYALAKAIIERWLQPDEQWWSVDVLAARDDRPAFDALLVGMQHRLVRLLLAVNGEYLMDPRPKWTRRLIEGWEHRPSDCASRLAQAQTAPPDIAASLLQDLFEETLGIVTQLLPTIDVEPARDLFRLRR